MKKIPGSLQRKKTGGIWYYVLYQDGKVIWRSTGATVKKTAWEIARTEIHPQLALSKNTPKTLLLLGQAIIKELKIIARDVNLRQADRAGISLQNFCQFVGNKLIVRITNEDLEDYQVCRLGMVAKSTVQKEMGFILRMFRRYDMNLKTPSPKAGKETDVRNFTEDGLIAFFNVVSEKYKTLFLTMLCTGARPAELIPSNRSSHTALLKSEVNLEQGIITIRSAKRKQTKRIRIREVGIDGELAGRLEKHMEQTSGDFVFSPVDKLCQVFDRTLIKAGIDKIDNLGRKLVAHSFRHTYGTRMASRMDQFALKEIMGHARITTTDRYVHSTTPEIMEISEVLKVKVKKLV